MRKIPLQAVNPGATEEELAALENRFHIQIPQDMKEFYRMQNGAFFYSGARLDPEGCQLRNFRPIGQEHQEPVCSIDQLLEWQEMDGFIPMYYVPFCTDEADDFYYVRVDEAGYGKIYYIFSEFLDDFLADPEGEGLIADSFTGFLEQIQFPAENEKKCKQEV